MLKACDYCDYELRLGLRDIGYPMSTCQINDGPIQMPKITLYEAQKWLREEKKLIVLVGFDFCPITSEIVYNWVIVVNGNTAKKSSYTYDYFEEALSEGIKEAVKILKDGNNN